MSASPAAHDRRSADLTRVRIAAIDNAKVLLVLLVVVGHALTPSTGQSLALADALFLWIYLFLMPAFAFVMGHITTIAGPVASSPKRLVTRLLVPYLIFNVFYLVLDQVLTERTAEFDLASPYWLTWFLLSMFWWRLLLPIFTQLRYPVAVSVLIALVSGAAPAVGAPFAASRTLALLPFFVLGATLNTNQVLWRGRRVGRAAGLLVLALAGLAAWQLRDVVSSAPDWLFWNAGYADQHYDLFSGIAVRGMMLAAGTLLTCAFLLAVPRARTGYTMLGSFVVYAYLLHGPVILLYRQTGLPDLLHRDWQVGVLVALAVALALGCMHHQVRRVMRPVIQPRLTWLFERSGQDVASQDATPPRADDDQLVSSAHRAAD